MSYGAYFKELIDLNPSSGSFLGYKKYDFHVENALTDEYQDANEALSDKYRAKLPKNPKTLDQRILAYIVNDSSEEYSSECLPISSFSNIIIEFAFSNETLYQKMTKPRHIHALLSRYKCMTEIIHTMQVRMVEGIKKRCTLPMMIAIKVVKQLKECIKNKSHISYNDNDNDNTYLQQLPSTNKQAMQHAYNAYIEYANGPYTQTIMAFTKFMEDEYVSHCRKTVGWCGLPNGKKWYTSIVKEYTTLKNATPEELHEYGYAEIRRLQSAIRGLSVEEISSKSLDTKEEVLDAFETARRLIHKYVLPANFHRKVQSYKIHEVPKMLEESAPAAFYFPPSIRLRRPGYVYLNLRNPSEIPDFDIIPLSLHEGEPGHHLQFQYMLDKKLPDYRIYGAPSDAMAEGWALYVENFVEDLVSSGKLHKTVLYGHYASSMFRAVRLVVDTGLHYYGWSYDRTLKFMMEHIPLKKSILKTELERYICDPGQALCYKTGERVILELRSKFFKHFPNGDIRDFHEMILEDGLMPLDILKVNVAEKIKRFSMK
jgi:uncharacterized protein (DUF885 family)